MNPWPVQVLAGRSWIGAGFEWTRKKGDSTSLFDERCAADGGCSGGQVNICRARELVVAVAEAQERTAKQRRTDRQQGTQEPYIPRNDNLPYIHQVHTHGMGGCMSDGSWGVLCAVCSSLMVIMMMMMMMMLGEIFFYLISLLGNLYTRPRRATAEVLTAQSTLNIYVVCKYISLISISSWH